MANNNKTTEKTELEIKALTLYCTAMQIWIDQSGGAKTGKLGEGSNPPTPPPPPPNH